MTVEIQQAHEARLRIRDGIVRAYASPQTDGVPYGQVRTVDSEAILLTLLATGGTLAVVVWNALGAPRVRALIRDLKRGAHHIVLVGVEPGEDARARALLPAIQFGKILNLHVVRDDGSVATLSGDSIPSLAEAVQGALQHPVTLTPELVTQWSARTRKELKEELDFALALQFARRPATTAVLTILSLVFAAQLYFGGFDSAVLYRMGALDSAAVQAGQWYRLLSCAFLHGDILHFAFNALAFLSLARLLEGVVGPTRLVVLLCASALAGGMASALRDHALSVGASGGIWGMLAGALGLVIRPTKLMPDLTQQVLRKRLISAFAINAAISLLPRIDAFAHAAGGAVGFALMFSGVLTRGLKNPTEADPSQARSLPLSLASAVLGAAALASLGMAVGLGRPWEFANPVELGTSQEWVKAHWAQLPVGLKRNESASNLDTLTVGNLDRDPIVVSLERGRYEGEHTADALVAHANATTPRGAKPVTSASAIEVAGAPAAVETSEIEGGLRLRRVVRAIEFEVIETSVLTGPAASDAWLELAVPIAASVKLVEP